MHSHLRRYVLSTLATPLTSAMRLLTSNDGGDNAAVSSPAAPAHPAPSAAASAAAREDAEAEGGTLV